MPILSSSAFQNHDGTPEFPVVRITNDGPGTQRRECAKKVPSIFWFPSQSLSLKIIEKVSFNIASEASYIYILSEQKLIKNGQFLANFWKPEAFGQTELPDVGQKIGGKFKCDILGTFQTLCAQFENYKKSHFDGFKHCDILLFCWKCIENGQKTRKYPKRSWTLLSMKMFFKDFSP